MLDTWTFENFSPLVREEFLVKGTEGDALPLVLVEAELLRMTVVPREDSPSRKPFALRFKGPTSPILPQRIYSFSHPALGDFEMFIVPLGQKEGGIMYEAIFT